jgi:hypothetical protein
MHKTLLTGRISGASRRKPGFPLVSFAAKSGKRIPLQSLAHRICQQIIFSEDLWQRLAQNFRTRYTIFMLSTKAGIKAEYAPRLPGFRASGLPGLILQKSDLSVY